MFHVMCFLLLSFSNIVAIGIWFFVSCSNAFSQYVIFMYEWGWDTWKCIPMVFFSSFCLYRIHGVSSVAMRSPPLFHTPQWMRMQARTLTAEIRWFVISDISTSHLPVPFTRQNTLKTSKPNDSKNKRRKKRRKTYLCIHNKSLNRRETVDRMKKTNPHTK